MRTDRKYPIAYRPKTCFVNLTLKYYPHKYDEALRSNNKNKVAEAMKKVKSVDCEGIRITLDYNNEPPTEKLRMKALKQAWDKAGIKDKFEDYTIVIRNLKVLTESRVNYDFDEFIH